MLNKCRKNIIGSKNYKKKKGKNGKRKKKRKKHRTAKAQCRGRGL